VNGGDDLDRIWSTPDQQTLVERYDAWAEDYDEVHAAWGWGGPAWVADVLLARAWPRSVLDAGCGTGLVGAELRARGWTGRLVGVDLSPGMLGRADARGGYDRLVAASLSAVPLPDAAVGAVLASGVFTHGHVGSEVFPELVRLTEPGGLIVITCRDDVWGGLAAGAAELAAAGAWTLVDRSASRPLHPGRETDGGAQSVVIWQVGGAAERASPKGRPSGGG